MAANQLENGFYTRPAMIEDAQAVVDLGNAYSRSLIGSDIESMEERQSDWQMPGFDLTNDAVLVCEPTGQVVGYGDVWDIQSPYVHKYSIGYVHPSVVGRGIGAFLLGWIEARARERMNLAPEGAQVGLYQLTMDADRRAVQLFSEKGFTHIRTTSVMYKEIETQPVLPSLPPGLEIRPVRPGRDELEAVRASREAFRDHWGYVHEPVEQTLVRWKHMIDTSSDFDYDLWLAVYDGDEVVATLFAFPSTADAPGMAWIGNLGVRRAWRHRGVGQALLERNFYDLYQRGIRKVGLSVDASSLTGATRLYERVGMYVNRQYNRYEKILRPGTDLSTRTLHEEGSPPSTPVG